MATDRTINAPGIEIREYDRSQYNVLVDSSLPNAPMVFMFGFADMGEDYAINWINNQDRLINLYGYPTNEPERYFWNGIAEILSRGGRIITAKLPYYNNATDRFSYVDYKISNKPIEFDAEGTTSSRILKILNQTDSNISSMIEIGSEDHNNSGLISIEDYDKLKIGESNNLPINTIRIVNKIRNKYNPAAFNCVSSTVYTNGEPDIVKTNEILGIIPVLVSPTEALYYQNLLEIKPHDTSALVQFNPVYTFETVEKHNVDGTRQYDPNTDLQINLDELSNNIAVPFESDNLVDNTVSKTIVSLFPRITWKNEYNFDTEYFKQIGVIVLTAFVDGSSNNFINFGVLESFIGSINPKSKNYSSKTSNFIDDIVNTNSRYINIFTNINKPLIDNFDIVHVKRHRATSLGFYNLDTVKHIDYQKSIIRPINLILERLKDKNTYYLDLILDGGITNIAQHVWNFETRQNSTNFIPDELMDVIPKNQHLYSDLDLEHINVELKSSDDIKQWKNLVMTFDNFCKLTRKDCMFIFDSPKGFCLEGDNKIIRSTAPDNTIKNNIIPKLRYLTGINSNYSAGYCNWFRAIDNYSSKYYWCPPSTKVAGIITTSDIYNNPWAAPAGFNRGRVSSDIIDLAFNPTQEEAGDIYSQSWNYAMSYPLNGIIVEGQKTMQKTQTALDRINVRRLMLYLEKTVASIAKYFVYEQNTKYLRIKLLDALKPVFEDAVHGSGISEYVIKCDDEINDVRAIENNELHLKIAVKPVKTIEFIVLSFIVTNQSANVSEEVNK